MHEHVQIHVHTALVCFSSLDLKQVWDGLERNVGIQSLWFQSQQSPFTTYCNQSLPLLLFSIYLQLRNSLSLLVWTFNSYNLLTFRAVILLELLGNPQLAWKSPKWGKRTPADYFAPEIEANKCYNPMAKYWKGVNHCTVAFLLLELSKNRRNKHFSGIVWVSWICFSAQDDIPSSAAFPWFLWSM